MAKGEPIQILMAGLGTAFSGYSVYTYVAGSGGATTKALYEDIELTSTTTNPVVLDQYGRCSVALYGSGLYEFIVKDTDGATVITWDDLKFGSIIEIDSFVNVSDYATFNAAITAIGSTPATLLIDADCNCTLDTTVLATTTIMGLQGNLITITSGKVLTINGYLDAGVYQIFSGSGTVSGLSEAYPEWWGAKGDESIASLTAIQSATSAINGTYGAKLIFQGGVYNISGEWSLAGISKITIQGSELYKTRINNINASSGRSAVSLIGASYITMRDLEIYNASAANSPKAGLILGRSDAGSYGFHRFERMSVRGYAATALVYDIASEENSWDNIFFSLDGGGAKYVYYTSQADDLSLTGFTTSTNLSKYFHHFRIVNASTVANSANIYINGRGSTGDIYFRDGFMAAAEGSHVRIFSNTGDEANGPYVFDSIRMEDTSSTDYNFHFDGDLNTSIFNTWITNCNGSNVGTNFLYGADNVTLHTATIMNNQTLKPSSLYAGSLCFIHDHSNTITFRNNFSYGFAFAGGSGGNFVETSGAAGSFIFENGALRNTNSILTDASATPSVLSGNFFNTGTTGVTITALYDGKPGQRITIISKGAIVFDTSTATRLIGSSVNITTANGDVTEWICETGGTTLSVWRLVQFTDVSADNSGGT